MTSAIKHCIYQHRREADKSSRACSSPWGLPQAHEVLGASWPLPNSPWCLDLQMEEVLTRPGKKQPTIVRQVQVTDGAGVRDEILDDLGPR